MAFTNKPQPWKNVGVKPTEILAEEGFKAGYKPPAAYFNYLFNNYYKCLEELQQVVGSDDSGATPKIKFIEKTLALSEWKQGSGEYTLDIDTTENTAQICNVYFAKESLQDAINAGVKPVTNCLNGVVTIYADRVLDKSLSVTVEIVKGGW